MPEIPKGGIVFVQDPGQHLPGGIYVLYLLSAGLFDGEFFRAGMGDDDIDRGLGQVGQILFGNDLLREPIPALVAPPTVH